MQRSRVRVPSAPLVTPIWTVRCGHLLGGASRTVRCRSNSGGKDCTVAGGKDCASVPPGPGPLFGVWPAVSCQPPIQSLSGNSPLELPHRRGGPSSRGAARGAGGSGLLNGIAGIGSRRRASRHDGGRSVTSRLGGSLALPENTPSVSGAALRKRRMLIPLHPAALCRRRVVSRG